jgi:hypothetical protein
MTRFFKHVHLLKDGDMGIVARRITVILDMDDHSLPPKVPHVDMTIVYHIAICSHLRK